jgi:hypothetical protein
MNTFHVRIPECFKIQIHDVLLTNEFSKGGFHVLRYTRLELPCGQPASDSYNPATAVQFPLCYVYHLAVDWSKDEFDYYFFFKIKHFKVLWLSATLWENTSTKLVVGQTVCQIPILHHHLGQLIILTTDITNRSWGYIFSTFCEQVVEF